jgi:hypothetical protein
MVSGLSVRNDVTNLTASIRCVAKAVRQGNTAALVLIRFLHTQNLQSL